ncbi:MAG TPA: hypothetical protein VNY34_05325 [Solirubrobacteraceae bacterium]|nr:hypothetical protein [Solirubrobacteraceae bacterium]
MLLAAGALVGCVETTQQKNARVQLQDDRLLASRSPVRVMRADPGVTVLAVRILRTRAGTAIAATLRNDGARPVSDLPVSVGVQTSAGRLTYLNRQPELPYFETHVAGIAGKGQTTWVFTTASRAPAGRAFARVGVGAIPVDRRVTQLPAIASSVTSVGRAGQRAIAAGHITNRSSVSQTGLQVYAYALSGQRLVAAGTATVSTLVSGTQAAVQIPLVGDPGSSALQLQIPPTNLR